MKILFIVLLVTLLGCELKKKDSTNFTTKVESKISNDKVEDAFDSLMAAILEKYRYGPQFKAIPTLSLHEAYGLSERLYIPKFHSLTFDFRELYQSTGDLSSVIHIYNDTLQCIVSFTDLQYYYWQSLPGNEQKYMEHFNFEQTLNDAVSTLNLHSIEEIETFLNYLVSFYHLERVKEPFDFECFKLKNTYFITHVTKRRSCSQDLKINKKFVANNYQTKKSFTYSDGALIYFFKILDNGHIETNILNFSCRVFFLY